MACTRPAPARLSHSITCAGGVFMIDSFDQKGMVSRTLGQRNWSQQREVGAGTEVQKTYHLKERWYRLTS